MPFVECASTWRRARPWLSAVAAAALVIATLAGPALAEERTIRSPDAIGTTRLRDPGVSQRTARPSTTIRFWVTYRNGAGAAPTYVRVLIDGRPRAMTTASATDHYRRGVRYAYATKLPVGRHRVRFEAMSTDGLPARALGGAIRIVASSSGGGSTGNSSSGDGGSGGGSPGGDGPVGPVANPGSEDPSPTGANKSDDPVSTTDGSRSGPADGGDGGWNDPELPPGVAAEEPESPAGAVDAADDQGPAIQDAETTPSPGPAAPGSVDTGSSGGSQGRGSGASGGSGGSTATAIGLPGTGHGPFDGVLKAYPVMVTTTGTVVVWAAFVFFGKRRRDGEPPAPDPVLAARAAAVSEPYPVAELVPPLTSLPAVPPGVDPSEAGLPRWRRPSLILARKTDPMRMATEFTSLTFADGAVEPYDGYERHRIRYRLVSLLDVPDEVRANEIAVLDEGDEVQVLEACGAYRLVLCPDGQEGWLHKMVIGELVEDTDGLAPDGIDEDVLLAFLNSRHQQSA